MNALNCPDRLELVEFSLGTSDDESAERISRHLDNCSACAVELGVLSNQNNPFVDNLRECATNQFVHESEFRLGISNLLGDSAGVSYPISTPSRQNDLTGRTLRDYRLLEKLGQGGMGRVYKAIHGRLDRTVAVKTIYYADGQDHKNRLKRFEREIKAVGRLNHPSIVRAHDAGEDNGVLFLVTEFIDGIDLAELSAKSQQLRVADACEIIRQVAEALVEVANLGMVHRDLKPSNLMLTKESQVKVLDLGLALLEKDADSKAITRSGQIMGTVDYMAPEQFGDSHQVDRRADIYSLGCSLYQFLSGKPPFAESSNQDVLKRMFSHATQRVPDLRALRPDIDQPLWKTIRRMLAKNPDDRFQSYEDLVKKLLPHCKGADLRRLASRWMNQPKEQNADECINPKTTRFRLRQVYRRLAVPLGAFTLVLVAIFFSWLTWKNTNLASNDHALLDDAADMGVFQQSIELFADLPPSTPIEPFKFTSTGAISATANVSHPARIEGVESWTLETTSNRQGLHAIAAAPNGQWVAVGGVDSIIRIRSKDGQRLLRMLVGHNGAIVKLAASPDGSMLAAGSTDGMLRIWATKSGRIVATICVDDQIDDMTWDVESKRIAFCHHGCLFRWDFMGGHEPRMVFRPAVHRVRCVAWRTTTPYSRHLEPWLRSQVAVAVGAEVLLVNVDTGDVMHHLCEHESEVTALAWTPNGSTIASAQRAPHCQVWHRRVESSDQTTKIDVPGVHHINALAWSDNARLLAGSCKYNMSRGHVYVWSYRNPEPRTMSAHAGEATGVSWLDSRHVASIGAAGSFSIWDLERDEPLPSPPHVVENTIEFAVTSADGRLLGLNLYDQEGSILDLFNGRLLPTQLHLGSRSAWSWDSRYLAMSTTFPHQLIIRPDSGSEILAPVTGELNALTWSPVGYRLAYGNGPRIVILDVSDPSSPHAINGIPSNIVKLQWSPDAKRLAAQEASNHRSIKTFDVLTRRFQSIISTPDDFLDFAWHPVNDIVAVSFHSGISFFDPTEGTLIESLRSIPLPEPNKISWSPDGTRLAIFSVRNSRLEVWDVKNHVCLGDVYVPSKREATVIDWSGNPDAIVFVSNAGLIRIYSGRSLAVTGTVICKGDLRNITDRFAFGSNGHAYLGPAAELVSYVAITTNGQEVYLPWQFREKFGWKNDRNKVGPLRH